MDEEKLTKVIREALEEERHKCVFNDEERVIVRDLIAVGKIIRKAFLMALALFLLVGAVFMLVHMSHSDVLGACWVGEIEWETLPKILVGVSLPVSVGVVLTILT